MSVPSGRIVGSNGLHREADRFLQGLLRPCPYSPHNRLEFGEGVLDGREVRGIGREEEQVTTALREGLTDARGLMHAQVVQHHHLTWSELSGQLFADIPRKGFGSHRAFDHPGLAQTLGRERGHQRRILPVIAGD